MSKEDRNDLAAQILKLAPPPIDLGWLAMHLRMMGRAIAKERPRSMRRIRRRLSRIYTVNTKGQA